MYFFLCARECPDEKPSTLSLLVKPLCFHES